VQHIEMRCDQLAGSLPGRRGFEVWESPIIVIMSHSEELYLLR